MRLLANEISKKNIFDWLKDLERCVDNLLSTSELDSINKDRCKKHFEDIVISVSYTHLNVCMLQIHVIFGKHI